MHPQVCDNYNDNLLLDELKLLSNQSAADSISSSYLDRFWKCIDCLYSAFPGPPGLPLVDNSFQMTMFIHINHVEWAKKYGPIFKYTLLGNRYVLKCGY